MPIRVHTNEKTQGQNKNPKFKRKVRKLITCNHSDLAQTKSLIKAMMTGTQSVPTLVDSGAESIIMDARLFGEIRRVNKNIKLTCTLRRFICITDH